MMTFSQVLEAFTVLLALSFFARSAKRNVVISLEKIVGTRSLMICFCVLIITISTAVTFFDIPGVGIAFALLVVLVILNKAEHLLSWLMHRRIEKAVPEIVDLLVMHSNFGLSFRSALHEALQEQPEDLRERLNRLVTSETTENLIFSTMLGDLIRCFRVISTSGLSAKEHLVNLQVRLRTRSNFKKMKQAAVQQAFAQWILVLTMFFGLCAWASRRPEFLASHPAKIAFALIVLGSFMFVRAISGFSWRI
jgi:Flp pilus assembly protein TadB